MTPVLTALTVFVAVFIADVCWTFYIAKTSEKKAWAAGFWSAAIMLVGSYSMITWMDDKRMLIPAALGAFVGTVATIAWNNNKEAKNVEVTESA